MLLCERIGVRELRQHASRYLERVKAGETVEVTERGELIALLVPPTPASNARERLIATGRLTPGSGPVVMPRRVKVSTKNAAISSESAKVEVVRACRRLDPSTMPAAQVLLAPLDLILLAGAVIEQTCSIGGPTLRSLDALHLASALTIGADPSAYVVFDHRRTASALDAGLSTLRPGA